MTELAAEVEELVARALAEDLGEGDITAEATVPAETQARARIVQKEPGVVFGRALVAEAMRQCGVEHVDNLVVEGQWREEVPAEVLVASGSARAPLAAERAAVKFLGHLSGVATLTARHAGGAGGTRATDPHNPQTTPGARRAGEGGGRPPRGRHPPTGP